MGAKLSLETLDYCFGSLGQNDRGVAPLRRPTLSPPNLKLKAGEWRRDLEAKVFASKPASAT